MWPAIHVAQQGSRWSWAGWRWDRYPARCGSRSACSTSGVAYNHRAVVDGQDWEQILNVVAAAIAEEARSRSLVPVAAALNRDGQDEDVALGSCALAPLQMSCPVPTLAT